MKRSFANSRIFNRMFTKRLQRAALNQAGGRLSFGPEIPVDDMGEVFQAIITLVSTCDRNVER
jgi:hypothetical protein